MKRIFVLVLACVLLFCAGCTVKTSDKQTESNPDAVAVGKRVNQSKPGKVAEGFAESLIKSDFVTARTLLYAPEDSVFFTEKDVEWYMPRSQFAEFVNHIDDAQEYKLNAQEVKTDGSQSSYKVTATDKEDNAVSLTLNLQMDNNNKWFVFADEFYVSDWHFVTPGGDTKVTIDGMALSDSIKSTTYGSQGLRKLYTIPCIGKSEKKILLSAEKGFGNKEIAVNPMTNSDGEPFACTVEATDEKLYQGIADLFNACSELVEQGKTASDFMPYVSTKADTNVATAMFDGIKKAGGALSGDQSGFRCSNVRPCSDAEWKSYYLTDTIVYAAFNYNMTWNYKLMSISRVETMQNYADLIIDTSDSKYTVYDAKDRFFVWFNGVTKKSK